MKINLAHLVGIQRPGEQDNENRYIWYINLIWPELEEAWRGRPLTTPPPLTKHLRPNQGLGDEPMATQRVFASWV